MGEARRITDVVDRKGSSYATKASALGLVIMTVFALSAVVSSAAQAATSEFEWANGTTSVERLSNATQKFIWPGIGSFECNEIHMAANVTGTKAASVTTNSGSLKYSNSGSANTCPASLGTMTITTHECEYQFVAGMSTGTGTSSGTMNIVNCPSTAPIEFNTSGICLIKVSNQTGIGPIIYKMNAVSPSTVNIELHTTNVAYSSSGFCGTRTAKDAEFSGVITVRGTIGGPTGTSMAVKVIP